MCGPTNEEFQFVPPILVVFGLEEMKERRGRKRMEKNGKGRLQRVEESRKLQKRTKTRHYYISAQNRRDMEKECSCNIIHFTCYSRL